jgi:hypothetical protein
MAGSLKNLIRGDMPLARAIFNNGEKRRLIAGLQADGWPIFEIAGKRCAFPDDLAAHARKVTRGGPAPRRGTAKIKRGRRRKAAGSTAAAIA